jgi:hypothetical protein
VSDATVVLEAQLGVQGRIGGDLGGERERNIVFRV